MIRVIRKAEQYARKQHLGQTRKSGKLPYITHPEAVYKIAKSVTNDEAILAACWLHDTIEDTPTTYKDLKTTFGKEIADIVLAVSDDKSATWEIAKEQYLKSVFANEKAIIVAWADKMHNTMSLAGVDDFKVFNRPIKQKLDYYSRFADMLKDEKLKRELKLVLDTIYDIVYYIDE